MAITKFIILTVLQNVVSHSINLPISKDSNKTSHLQFEHIQRLCVNRHVCKANLTVLCTVRLIDDVYEYKNYENSCFLFLSNLCDYPGKEFSIVSAGECADEITSRRMFVSSGVAPPVDLTTEKKRNSTKAYLRQASTTTKFSTLYPEVTAFDGHPCSLRCPNIYNPVCMAANRGYGTYFKFWTFENHCAADVYYCAHPEEFKPPPVESGELVRSSPIGWSFCGAHRYLQFARFSEATSSMGHYGWLHGDYNYQHIMEPHERKPGYG